MRLLVLSALLLQASAPIERVTVTTSDGSMLGARFYNAGTGSPGVLFFPMCSPVATEGWAPVAARLREAGVSSMIVTYRGTHGNTTGSGTGEQRGPDADAAVAFLQSRIRTNAPVAFAGSSCGVSIALRTAAAHPDRTRAVVVISGRHSAAQLDYVRKSPRLAVFSSASAAEPPSPEWARALKAASAHPASRVEILDQHAHGTDLFAVQPALVNAIADWLIARLNQP
jgi:pimeloyl-ACP methyl ester carboxylesterase